LRARLDHDRIYDPANHRDRRSLIDDANDSEYEAAKISDRSRRSAAASGANGTPHGTTPFGYRRVYDVTSGRLLEQVPHPDEAPIVQEFFRRVLAGESMRSIRSTSRRAVSATQAAVPSAHSISVIGH
jgi:hypothetical protein